VLLAVTRRGVYLSPDGLAYVGTARNLVHGRGFTAPPGSAPISNFAPLFTLVLAGLAKVLSADPVTVARYLNPLLAGLTVLVVGLLVRRLTGSVPLAMAGQLLVLSGMDFLAYHSAALSEPLFVATSLLALCALSAAVRRPSAPAVVAAALFAGAAAFTRYVGVALVVAGVVALLLLAPRKSGWKAAAAPFAVLAASPLVGWLLWLHASQGRATNRAAVFHAPGLDYLNEGLRTASTWFLPDTVGWPARGVIAAVVVLDLAFVAALTWRRDNGYRGKRGVAVVAMFAVAYLAALVADRAFFDVTGRLDLRFLLPLHAAAVPLALWVLRSVDLRTSHLARVGLTVIVALQLVAGGVWVRDALTDESVRPGGFGSALWARSDAIDQVRAAAPSAPVYSNEPDAVWYWTGRVADAVPEKRVFLTGKANRLYGAQLLAMAAALRRGGLLVYFTATPARTVFLPTPDELAGRLQLTLVSRDAIGRVYRAPGPSPP
jgi:hypothetical protein